MFLNRQDTKPGGATNTASNTASAGRISTEVQYSSFSTKMVRNYQVLTRLGCWQDYGDQNEPLFVKIG